jgi:prepilin-type N-terminal cleavage/methylation domain-containing protein
MTFLEPETRVLPRDRASLRGLTLSEMMVSMSVFGIAVMGLVYTQMFGMFQDQLVNSKSGACEMARLSFNDLVTDIRAAKIWQVGNGSVSSFTPIPLGTAQQGNAIMLSMTIDTNQYTVYYFDTNACKLLRRHNGAGTPTAIAQFLTNSMYFVAETFQGTTQYDLSHKGVIHVAMQFCQYQYPLTRIGPGYFYNSYTMNLWATPHVPDGP